MKRKAQRGWRASHSRIFGCLWTAPLSTMAWITLPAGDMRFDGIEKANKLLMEMALHIAADDRSVEHIQSSEQRGGTMAFVVVRHGSGAAVSSTASPVGFGRVPESGFSYRPTR